jgi:hypothetical protein
MKDSMNIVSLGRDLHTIGCALAALSSPRRSGSLGTNAAETGVVECPHPPHEVFI